MSASANSSPLSPNDATSMVRYSLPELLAELKHERLSGSLGMEKLHQTEIGKLFQTKPKRRRGKSNQ